MSEEQIAASLKLWAVLRKHAFIWEKNGGSCRKITRKTGLREASLVIDLSFLLIWILFHPQVTLVPHITIGIAAGYSLALPWRNYFLCLQDF